MEELVITIITVIKLIYRRNSMEKKEKEKESKQANKTKFKTIGYIALFMDHYPRNG